MPKKKNQNFTLIDRTMDHEVSARRNAINNVIRHGSMIKRIFVLIGVLSITSAMPKNVEASVIFSTLSQRNISVGDRINFSVTTVVPKGATVTPPDPANAFGSLVVKEWNSKKQELSKADSIVFDYVITTYKAEDCTIPALSYITEYGAVRDSLKTVAAPLHVVPLCTADTLDIMDLKPQQVAGKRPLLWLWLLLSALAIVAGVLVVRHIIIKLKKPLPPPPPKPPYDEAVEALAALEAEQLLLKGMVREYVFALSDILKRYIERTFGINAAEFTTEEMLAWIGISPLDKTLRASMEWFFRAADPIKFAKYLPEQKTIDRFITEVRAFLEATKPRETADSEGEDGATAVQDARKATGGAA
jgi:hypothetical protein